MKKNNEFFFYNIFDMACYMFVAILYPALSYLNLLIQKTDKTPNNELVTISCFLIFTLFYDFYQRYKGYFDSKNQTKKNGLLTLRGMWLFGTLSALSILILFGLFSGWFPKTRNFLIILIKCLPISVVYPCFIVVREYINRYKKNKNRVMGKVSV